MNLTSREREETRSIAARRREGVSAALTFIRIGKVETIMAVAEQNSGDRIYIHRCSLDVVRVDEADGWTPQEVHLFLGY